MATGTFVTDFEDVQKAWKRVEQELDAVQPGEVSQMNVDLVSATSIVLGVADRALSYRERIAKLPEFDVGHVDRLVDYAKATWFLAVTNQRTPDAKQADALLKEAGDMRAKLLVWAAPLVASGYFAEDAVARVREGGGYKDLASDLVALVALYRSRWDAVSGIIGVTEAELTRAAELGTAAFAIAAKKENADKPATAEGSLRLRRAWTRLDLAYSECRRAVEFLRPRDVPLDEILPSMRRNAGRPSGGATTASPATSASASAGSSAAGPAASTSAPGLGNGGSPFVNQG